MEFNGLTKDERRVAELLPRPPTSGAVRISNVWIIEWLRDDPKEQKTGQLLHQWMEGFRPGWSAYRRCDSKLDVLAEINRATSFAKRAVAVPVLHLESHGAGFGLSDRESGGEILRWEELTESLQQLNLVTKCNLMIFVAACSGFAGIKALTQGPRAPAVALVGPAEKLPSSDLLLGTKEFYRRLCDSDAHLQRAAESASNELRSTAFEPEPYVALAYEAFVQNLLVSLRLEEIDSRKDRIRRRLIAETVLSSDQIERRLDSLPSQLPDMAQMMWDTMFMMDLYPENRDRFGIDMRSLVALAVAATARVVNKSGR